MVSDVGWCMAVNTGGETRVKFKCHSRVVVRETWRPALDAMTELKGLNLECRRKTESRVGRPFTFSSSTIRAEPSG
jgi:hypothetical protein